MFHLLLNSLISCNHVNTSVNEGKCYCPDCGSGLIYRWVLLRCVECNARRESRYRFRQVFPSQRCCPFCGETGVSRETLDNPSYFQLNQARLVVLYEEAQPLRFAGWLYYLLGESLGVYALESIQTTFAWAEGQMFKSPPKQAAFALLPLGKSTL